MSWKTNVAFAVEVLATFVVALSLVVMKQSHHSVEQSEVAKDQKTKSGFCTCRFWVGVGLMAIGSILHVVVLPFLDIVVASISALTALFFSILLSIIMLNEKFIVKYDLTCFILMTVGGGTILGLSNTEEQSFTTEEVRQIFVSNGSIGFIVLYVALTITYFITKNALVKSTQRFGEDAAKWVSR